MAACSHSSFLFEHQHLLLSKEVLFAVVVDYLVAVCFAVSARDRSPRPSALLCSSPFALSLLSLWFLFPILTMKFDAAATAALFEEGVVGHEAIQALRLPADLFPADSTWNQFPDLSVEEQQRLRGYSFGYPVASTAVKENPLSAPAPGARRSAFISANASAIRYSPNHRIWTAEDVYASHQRRPTGCSLMVIRVPTSLTAFSEPFLLVTGPMTTPFLGYSLPTPNLFQLKEDSPPLCIHGDIPLPGHMHPTMVSASASPRDWLSANDHPSPLEELRNNGPLFTILQSTALHRTVVTYDATDAIWSRVSA
ncbi:MAG: hypothetical protein ACRCYW_14640, partial [Aeromonas sp.]|uniref:hypothetical protein n=1 Tax=Aeromonas sp. TaxID=647 RepID=UPI003F2DDD07